VLDSDGGSGISADFVVDAEPGNTGGSAFLSEYSLCIPISSPASKDHHHTRPSPRAESRCISTAWREALAVATLALNEPLRRMAERNMAIEAQLSVTKE
jgi:hypothetical protein